MKTRGSANLALALVLLSVQASSEDLESAELRWAAVRRNDPAQVAPGWSLPRRIDELSSPGWEDGAYLAPDGDTFYFVYSDIDLFRMPTVVRTGPDRDPELQCYQGCGRFPRADLFFATRRATGWSSPQIHPLTIVQPVGGFVLAGPDRAYFMSGMKDGWKADIGYADRTSAGWGPPRRIASVSSRYVDEDPWVGMDQSELWFTSDRPSSLGEHNIWISKREGQGWAEPSLAPVPLNTDAQDRQPFLHGGFVYFASTRDGGLAIYRSKRLPDGFAPPEKIVWSLNGVGEPTLSADGKTLGFVQVFRDGVRSTIDLFEVRRRPEAPHLE